MIETTSITVGVPVGDLEEATRWYTRVLNAGPELEPVRGIREFEVRPGTWLQLMEEADAPGGATFRLGVRDIHGQRRRLIDLGLEVSEVEDVDGVILLCDFADPWANRLSLYQVVQSVP